MNDEAIALIEALRAKCSDYDDCDDCPEYKWCHDKSCPTLCEAAAGLIESLVTELEQVKHERDAAVEDVAKLKRCEHCIRNDNRIENLELMNKHKHFSMHAKER